MLPPVTRPCNCPDDIIAGDCAEDCGDGCCSLSENAENCAVDMGGDCLQGCGDDLCTDAEDTTNCPADCLPNCPNGVCGSVEDDCNCPDDCPTLCGDCPADCPLPQDMGQGDAEVKAETDMDQAGGGSDNGGGSVDGGGGCDCDVGRIPRGPRGGGVVGLFAFWLVLVLRGKLFSEALAEEVGSTRPPPSPAAQRGAHGD